MITDDGCWADFRTSASTTHGKACLFLDRDGVLIEDSGYPSDPDAITLVLETLDLVRIANQRGFVVGIVSNQSGIGRGYFEWTAFAAVQGAIDAALSARDAKLDFVLACPHLASAPVARYQYNEHPWRKPAPGMLNAAANALSLDMTRSAMVGDRISDMEAAQHAGLRYRALLTGEGLSQQGSTWTAVSRDTLQKWFLEDVEAAPQR